jgi:hypothetical protein
MAGRRPGWIIIWEYRVRPGAEAEFERVYGPGGDWARLFRGAGYLGTTLWRDPRRARVYLTIDEWTSRDAHARCLARLGTRYEALDRRCATFTVREEQLGAFVPDAAR